MNLMKIKRVNIFFLLVLLLSLSVAAVSITTDKPEYTRGENVATTITCAGQSVLKISNANTPRDLVYLTQGKNTWSTNYNTNSDSSDGKYSLFASCEDRTTAEAFFCVNSQGCLEPAAVAPPPVVSESPPISGVSGGSSGGSARCVQRWTCVGQWSYCNATLQQSRSCYDRENCPNLPYRKLENRSCAQCDESWVCSEWSACQNDVQTRECSDEHFCTTARTKPWLQKNCQQTVVLGPTPARIISSPSPPVAAPPVLQRPAPPLPTPSFWEQYKVYLIAGISGLLALTAIILLVVHFVAPHHLVYNIEELKEWVRKEQKMGTPDKDIQDILSQHTGWKKEEIAKVMAS